MWDKETQNRPLAYDAPELAKVAILMTEGEFNYSTCHGVARTELQSTTGCNNATSFQQAETICTAMKGQGIIVYTAGLELNTALYSDGSLLGCATSPQHAFLAADIDELKAASKSIATSISKLRMSK